MENKKEYRGKVLVAGATGKTGQWVVKRLLQYGVPVRVFARDKAKAISLFGEGVEIVEDLIEGSIAPWDIFYQSGASYAAASTMRNLCLANFPTT